MEEGRGEGGKERGGEEGQCKYKRRSVKTQPRMTGSCLAIYIAMSRYAACVRR